MKPTFPRLLVLVLSIALGLAVSLCLTDHDVSDRLIPPIANLPAEETFNDPWSVRFVISVPADGEFYIGKNEVELSQITAVLTRWLSSVPRGEQVLYIKSADAVRFETLALVINEAKAAGIDRIEFLRDKKKPIPDCDLLRNPARQDSDQQSSTQL